MGMKKYRPNPCYASDAEIQQNGEKRFFSRKLKRRKVLIIILCFLLFVSVVWSQMIPTKTGLDSGWGFPWRYLQRPAYRVSKIENLVNQLGYTGESFLGKSEIEIKQYDLLIGDLYFDKTDPFMRTCQLLWYKNAPNEIVATGNSVYVVHNVKTVEEARNIRKWVIFIYDYKETNGYIIE